MDTFEVHITSTVSTLKEPNKLLNGKLDDLEMLNRLAPSLIVHGPSLIVHGPLTHCPWPS